MTSSNTPQQAPVVHGRPEVAFYYPSPMWGSGGWVKNLLLFFDGIGLLVPDYMRERPFAMDPDLAPVLHDRGLLHILEPEEMVDKAATEQLAAALVELMTSGAFDGLQASDSFASLSYSRLGYRGDSGLAKMLHEELERRKLARPSEDGVSVPMHPMVRYLVLVLLAQILRAQGARRGLDLAPVTDRVELVGALHDVLSLPRAPSVGRIIAADMETAAVDLSQHPLDEILDYRSSHGAEYRAYMRAVRQFVIELSQLPEVERDPVLALRQEELRDMVAELRTRASAAWKKPASIALAFMGALWTLGTGDVLGGVLSGGSALLGGEKADTSFVGAYSYLFGRGLVRTRVTLK